MQERFDFALPYPIQNNKPSIWAQDYANDYLTRFYLEAENNKITTTNLNTHQLSELLGEPLELLGGCDFGAICYIQDVYYLLCPIPNEIFFDVFDGNKEKFKDVEYFDFLRTATNL